jgi:hypothetical protein
LRRLGSRAVYTVAITEAIDALYGPRESEECTATPKKEINPIGRRLTLEHGKASSQEHQDHNGGGNA